jgi:hypothetical protein
MWLVPAGPTIWPSVEAIVVVSTVVVVPWIGGGV